MDASCGPGLLLPVMDQPDPIEQARVRLWPHGTFRHGERAITIAFLIRSADWRPLAAPWWRGKEACIIGADLDGNFFLRHCDGTVRYWDHRLQFETVVASSVREFVASIE